MDPPPSPASLGIFFLIFISNLFLSSFFLSIILNNLVTVLFDLIPLKNLPEKYIL